MRPSPIPDDEIWEGSRRVVIGAPDGSLDGPIRAAEVLIDVSQIGGCRISARITLDPGDLERLAAGEPFWVSFLADHLHPFDVSMTERI